MVVVVEGMDTKILNQPSGSVAGQTLPNIKDVVHEIVKNRTKDYMFWIMSHLGNTLDMKIAIRYGLSRTSLTEILRDLSIAGIWVYWINSYKDYLIIECTTSTKRYNYNKEDIRGTEFEVL